jgi:hypothetical protein
MKLILTAQVCKAKQENMIGRMDMIRMIKKMYGKAAIIPNIMPIMFLCLGITDLRVRG